MQHIWLIITMLALAAVIGCAKESWQADPEVVQRLSARRPGVNYEEAKVPNYTLPDPLRAADGSKIKTADQWTAHREELIERFRVQMYGRAPGLPEKLSFEVISEDPAALGGTATLRQVAIQSTQGGRRHEFVLSLFTPNGAKSPAPLLLLIDNRGNTATSPATSPVRGQRTDFWPAEQMIARGYATASFYTGDIAPDNDEHFREGIISTFEGNPATRPADAWAAISAWAWGASRAMDYLQTDSRIDARRVALIGHSRGGKTALWGAAQDTRFAMVYSNASGCGGAELSRRRFGETVKMINNRFPHWFCENFKQYNDREDELPFDQHQLLALIAPRPLYLAGATEDLWCDPRGNYLALSASSPVYKLFGAHAWPKGPMPLPGKQQIIGNRGWHMHEGKHDLAQFDWQLFMDFADVQWRRAKSS